MIVYTYVGYPCALWLRARWRSRPVKRAPNTPSVSIVMVVRNEDRYLDAKLRNLLGLEYPADRLQVVVVSDGSTDRTEAILREFSRDPRVHCALNQLPRGKASCLNDALDLANGELVVFTDVRQKLEPRAVTLLAENFADPEVGCASGELMLGEPESGESAENTGLYWRIEKGIRELESAASSVVGATGALFAARRALVPALPAGTILDDVYIPMHVVRQGGRVVFDERARAWDLPYLGAKREFRRKVRTLTGNYQLVQMAPWLLTLRNPLLLEFVSHKLLRLLMPFTLVLALVSAALLTAPLYRLALIAQVGLYALSILGLVPANKGPLARMTGAAFTFVMLNAAAAVAFANFVTRRKVAWS
jgi:cellulose synthase/poly-beta-1,6-N-acetylglucosamine synthase-like glycosyltransferase